MRTQSSGSSEKGCVGVRNSQMGQSVSNTVDFYEHMSDLDFLKEAKIQSGVRYDHLNLPGINPKCLECLIIDKLSPSISIFFILSIISVITEKF